MIVYETIWACALSVLAAVLVHEGGHLSCAIVTGQTPRVLMLGLGPVVLRLRVRTFTVVLRALPVTGYLLIEPTDRRWAYAVTIAGGPLANLLALAACLRAHVLWPDIDLAIALAIYQGLFAARTLWPSHGNVAGLQLASDGAKLYRLMRKTWTSPVTTGYAAIMAVVEQVGGPARAPTRYAARLVFECGRADQYVDAWARRDANASLRTLLNQRDLIPPERAFILCVLCAQHFVYDEGLATREELDVWSQEALRLTEQPLGRDTRGAVLLLQGRRSEAEALLREALDGYVERNGAESPEALLCRALLARIIGLAGRADEVEAMWRQAETAPAMIADPRLRMVLTRIKSRALPQDERS